jgi:hypothetical protein
MTIRYFYHPESDSLFTTTDGSRPTGDGLVEELDESQYRDIERKQGSAKADKAMAYVAFAAKIISLAKTEKELVEWWRIEADHREAYGVTNDSPEWRCLVKACADRKAAIILSPKGRAA